MFKPTIVIDRYSPDQFVQYVTADKSTDGCPYYTFLNGKIVHLTVPKLIDLIGKLENNLNFTSNKPNEKSRQCVGCKKTAPCKSYLCNHHCPTCFAKAAVFLRTPDAIPKEPYMGRASLGSEFTVRCISNNDDIDPEDVENFKFVKPFIARFDKGALSISIGGRVHPIRKWSYYVEEVDGKRHPIFEIFENIHFNQTVLSGDFKARFEGQPFCEELLKGFECECMAKNYPYHDSLPEQVVSAGTTGVFMMNKRKGKMLKSGKFGVRCAHARRRVMHTEREDKKPQKKFDKPIVSDDSKFVLQKLGFTERELELQVELNRARLRENQVLHAAYEKQRSEYADLERRYRMLKAQLIKK